MTNPKGIYLTYGAIISTTADDFILAQTGFEEAKLIRLNNGNRWSDEVLETQCLRVNKYNAKNFFGKLSSGALSSGYDVRVVTAEDIEKTYTRIGKVREVFKNINDYYEHKERNTCWSCDITEVRQQCCKEETCCKDGQCKKEIDVEALKLLLPATIMVANDLKTAKEIEKFEAMAKFLAEHKEKYLK